MLGIKETILQCGNSNSPQISQYEEKKIQSKAHTSPKSIFTEAELQNGTDMTDILERW